MNCPLESEYMELFHCAHAVFVLDVTTDGRFQIAAFNAAEEKLVGISNADAAGRFVDELFSDQVARAVVARYRHCIETAGPISYDEEIDVPAGHRHCVTTLVPIFDCDGRARRIVGVARDVTEEKLAIAALRVSEERFRQLAENIREVFWMTDAAKTEVLYVSPQYETLWGRTCASLEASPRSWLDSVHPSDRARVESALPMQRESAWETTYRIVRPDGSERWIRDRSFPVRDADGVVCRLVGLAEDVTQLVHTEEQLRHAQKIEAVGLLAAGIAHDFNNILSVILSYTEMLEGSIDPVDPRRDEVAEVRDAGQRAANLTRQLLAFSRKQVLAPRAIDLRESVRGLERMIRRVLACNIEVVMQNAPSLGTVRADPGQIEQVILNLVVNAGDAMPNGGTLTIRTSDVTLGASEAADVGAEPGEYVMMSVSDDGIGMDAATRDRVFEPFFTTKNPGKGTGLGLATVFGIVRQSGGAIRVRSAPGEGAAFDVFLPRVGDTAPILSGTPPLAVALEGTETVLIVEDEEHVRALAGKILRRAGYRVLEAETAGDALLVGEQHAGPIHLLLTDFVMPRLNGRQVAERLRSIRPELEVLFMSGYSEASVMEDGAEDALGEFLQKPITPDALCRKVRAVLDGHS